MTILLKEKMKRPKKTKIIKKETPYMQITYYIDCPHCHTRLQYITQMDFLDVLMFRCSYCRNPIDLREPEIK